jgi:hypothetical protein
MGNIMEGIIEGKAHSRKTKRRVFGENQEGFGEGEP